jgi:hypothetical protein
VGRIGVVEKLEEFDEFAAAMAILDQRMDLAGDEVDGGQQADRAVAPGATPIVERCQRGLRRRRARRSVD